MSPATATWTRIPVGADGHLPRSSHSVCVIENKAYIFGGEIQPRQPVDNAMHIVDVSTGEYTAVTAAGDAPAPRVGHTGVAIGTDIYVFGGRGGKDMTPLEEAGAVYVFSTTTEMWTRLLPAAGTGSEPTYPKPRSYHSATATTGHVIIHGGCPPPPSGRLSDIWAFDVASCQWRQLVDAPGKGRGGTAMAVLEGKLWRFGGFDGVGEQGGGVDSLDLDAALAGGEERSSVESPEWVFTPYAGEGDPGKTLPDGEAPGPGARSVTALLASGTSRLLAIMGEGKPSPTGGHDTAGGFYDDVWSFESSSGRWEEVQISQKGPGARGWFGADACRGGAVVWGGLNGENEREGDGWILTLGDD